MNPARGAVAAAGGALLAAVAGCAQVGATPVVNAGCSSEGGYNPALVVMAQSVPTAELIPCVESVPTGWYQGRVDLRNGVSTFVLGSDRDGPDALTVELRASCDLSGAVRVPSEHRDLERFERLDQLDGGYVGVRHYVADGSCTTFRFNLTGARQAQPVSEASLAVGFTTREAVVESVLTQGEGRLSVATLQAPR